LHEGLAFVALLPSSPRIHLLLLSSLTSEKSSSSSESS
jgi:hypothetical protein